MKVKEIKVNPWVEVEQGTPNVMLHIFSKFEKDFRGTPTLSMVNSWLELYQSTPKAIPHIYADFARVFPGCTELQR